MVLDAFYAQRAYARFYVLETIARVPYFGKLCDNSTISFEVDESLGRYKYKWAETFSCLIH
jgi:hypothetical protein